MGHRGLEAVVNDLERAGHLVRIADPIDPHLEMAEIQRRLYAAQGPALLFERPKGCRFRMLCNLFGTTARTHFLFRDTLESVRRLVELKIDPREFWKRPWRYATAPFTALHMLPRLCRTGPILKHSTTISALPQLKSWPKDGGAFVTLPQVYTEDLLQPGLMRSNLGMYRIQLSGNQYAPDREIGLHYQLHRGIGIHHTQARELGQPFRVNIFVGGNPAMTLAAVMPLPEGMTELTFAGALAGHRIRMVAQPGRPAIYADADFCITGTVNPDRLLPEGPFGDHLGYYSLAHDFPMMHVERVYHRPNAIWPFTVVGRPPQEDTSFGHLIHEITGPIIPTVLPGVKGVHAVDAAGVHPLLLAIGSERYTPYSRAGRPQELLTQANAILGQGQLSLAKYLFIVSEQDAPQLHVRNIPAFFRHVLERVQWDRDLHFQTRTTIDTLDYSGSGLNQGSKLVIAAAGPVVRELPQVVDSRLVLPGGFSNPRVCLPGVLALELDTSDTSAAQRALQRLRDLPLDHPLNQWPLLVLVDDAKFTSQTLNNFLWVAFTRSNPAADLHGIGEFTEEKHWGCRGSLILDARIKPHHAPPLIEDPEVTRRVDQLCAIGGPLYGILKS